jgi:diguanylate cyclase (GGDEF)-like protein
VNDTHGHLAGDDVLIEIAALLHRVVRAVDVVARYGGEEFIVVLPETGAQGAEAFAERLRELIEAQLFCQSRSTPIRLTTSIGVSSFPGFGVESDQALYRAKSEGRNRVRV